MTEDLRLVVIFRWNRYCMDKRIGGGSEETIFYIPQTLKFLFYIFALNGNEKSLQVCLKAQLDENLFVKFELSYEHVEIFITTA